MCKKGVGVVGGKWGVNEKLAAGFSEKKNSERKRKVADASGIRRTSSDP